MKRTKIIFLLWIPFFLLIWLRHGSPAAAVAALFGVLYAVVAALIVMLSGRDLKIDITGGGMVEKDAAMPGTITFQNKARIPVFLAEGKASVRNLLTGEEQTQNLEISLWPEQSRTEEMEVREKYCGRIDVTVKDLRVYDPLKLFHRKISAAGAGTGYVAPALFAVEIPAEYMESFNMESYRYSQYEKGSDTGEVFGLRDYQEGDSAKQIHWKLSAKLDEPVVKIPSFPIENNVLLLLDNLLAPEEEVEASVKSERMELFWSLSACLLENEIPHSVGWYDGEAREFSIHEIRNRQEMWAAVPASLSCGFHQSQRSAIYRYLESTGERGFSNHFIVTANKSRDIERLENYGAVQVFGETK